MLGNVTWKNKRSVRLERAVLTNKDIPFLKDVQRLVLVSSKIDDDILKHLPRLKQLVIFKGGSSDIGYVKDCLSLTFIEVNQVRGLNDLSALSTLSNIRLILLYGLPKVVTLQPLKNLSELKRLEIGSMKNLENLAGVYNNPNIEELLFMNKIGIDTSEFAKIRDSKTIKTFRWDALDGVPDKVWVPALTMVNKPEATPMMPEEWLALH